MLTHPVRLLPLTFLAAILVGAGVLMLPVSRHGDEGYVVASFFASTSAVTITGLASVDTATYWTPFGQGVILALAQIGGFGIMTFATMLGLAIGGRIGLRSRLIAQTETNILNLGDVRAMLRRIAVTMFGFEVVLAAILVTRYRLGYFADLPTALWHGTFDAVMAFNNAGFALESDSLTRYVGDAWVIVPVCVAVFAGGIGFPVMAELFRNWRRPDGWTIHTRLTVWGSLGLFAVGVVSFSVIEWDNPNTLGGMPSGTKLLAGLIGGVMPRSGGFNVVDYGEATPEMLAVTDALMFIGGGSASTAGGIKVTTFLLLAFVILAEIRGDPDVVIGNRRVGLRTLRQALAIALLSVMLVAVTAFVLMALTDYRLEAVMFEVISAFGTVGLSTGITNALPPSAEVVLMVLMFVGRIGPAVVASALALRRTPRRIHLPEERPIVG